MTNSSNASNLKAWTPTSPLHLSRYITDLNRGKLNLSEVHPDDTIWKSFLAAHPVVKFQRPDYFLIFRYTDSCKILYQENISLNLGGAEVNLENIYNAMVPADLQHIRETDQIMIQLIQERKLLPWDYIYKICANVVSPNVELKRIMRSSILIHRDLQGKSNLGLMYFHDVSNMVSSIKPNNYEIACEPELAFLADEIESRLKKSQSPKVSLTRREKEIVLCIRKGMSSKEIGEVLYISTVTVNTHRQNMLRKWEVPNTAALLEKCIERDLL